MVLFTLAGLARDDGDIAAAAALYREALAAAGAFGLRLWAADAVAAMAGLAVTWGDPRAAATLFGAAGRRGPDGSVDLGADVTTSVDDIARARAALGEAAFA